MSTKRTRSNIDLLYSNTVNGHRQREKKETDRQTEREREEEIQRERETVRHTDRENVCVN